MLLAGCRPPRVGAWQGGLGQVMGNSGLYQLPPVGEFRHPPLTLKHPEGLLRVGAEPGGVLPVQKFRHLEQIGVFLPADLLQLGIIAEFPSGETGGVVEERARLDALHLLAVTDLHQLHRHTLRPYLCRGVQQMLRLAAADEGGLVDLQDHLERCAPGAARLSLWELRLDLPEDLPPDRSVMEAVQETVDGVGRSAVGFGQLQGGFAGIGEVDGVMVSAAWLQDLAVEPLDDLGGKGLTCAGIALGDAKPSGAR